MCNQGFEYWPRSRYSFVEFVDIAINYAQMRPIRFQLRLKTVKKSWYCGPNHTLGPFFKTLCAIDLVELRIYMLLPLQVNIIRITRQLEYFQEYQQRVSALVGDEKTKELVNGALVLITCGGNDFVNNYYLVPNSARSRQFALPDYVTFVISEYKKVLRVIPPLSIINTIYP